MEITGLSVMMNPEIVPAWLKSSPSRFLSPPCARLDAGDLNVVRIERSAASAKTAAIASHPRC